jgi:hypothetical protein
MLLGDIEKEAAWIFFQFMGDACQALMDVPLEAADEFASVSPGLMR